MANLPAPRRNLGRRGPLPGLLLGASLLWAPAALAQTAAAPVPGGADSAAQAPAAPRPGVKDLDPGDEPAPSGSTRAEAQRRYQEGVALYKQGLYRSALAEFEGAYQNTRLPALLYNIGHTYKELRQFDAALDYYERYLKTLPPGGERSEIAGIIFNLQREIALEQAESRRQQEQLAQQAVQAAQREKQRQPVPRPAVALVAVGGAALLTGVGLGIGALLTARTVQSGERYDPALEARGRTLSTAGIALDVVGAAAASAGAIWLGVWKARRGESRTALRLSTSGTGVTLHGAFR